MNCSHPIGVLQCHHMAYGAIVSIYPQSVKNAYNNFPQTRAFEYIPIAIAVSHSLKKNEALSTVTGESQVGEVAI